jgi:hypothetical protein
MSENIRLSKKALAEVMALPGNTQFKELIVEALLLHARKNLDYSSQSRVSDGLDNFTWAAAYAGTTPRVVFRVLLGVKDRRERNLVLGKREPLNESLQDTYKDRVNYAFLELAYSLAHPELIDTVLTLVPMVANSGEITPDFQISPA